MISFFQRRRIRKRIDGDCVARAIAAAERQTSGEIRVSIARFFWGDVRRVAERTFVRMGMAATEERNGILFFIVPSRRTFVVLGDEGIHAKVGPQFWTKVADAVSERFQSEDFTGGIVHGIEAVGRELAAYFPIDAGADKNELSDEIDFGDDPRRGP